MDLTLQRAPSVNATTLGHLSIDGAVECDTLEDRIREIPGQPVATWKVWGETAIPAGRFRVVRHLSPKFGSVLMLFGIPGFDLVYFHAGNDDADTHGCILVGRAVLDPQGDGGDLAGGSSKPARAALEAKVFPALDAGAEVWCTILNPLTTRAA